MSYPVVRKGRDTNNEIFFVPYINHLNDFKSEKHI